jgi:hypothetical protein
MNWKNVLYLLRVERKSGRLVRGAKATKYKENKFTAYWPYWVAAIIGILGGLLANFIVGEIYSEAEAVAVLPPLNTAAVGFFVTLPTMVLLFSIVLSMMQQIQLSGVKASTQVMYWLPITWQEQTLASILANLLGFPVAIAVGVSAGLLTFAALNGMFLFGWAIATSLIMFAAAFVGSATTEIVRVLQTRFLGAVYKSSGKAAVWVRFAGSLIFFVIFYVLYFGITQGPNQFFQGLSSIQSSIWFIPFVWPALTLYYFIANSILYGVLFLALSAVFIAALYFLAINLNERFGLYEPPAIKIQTSGVYAPKTGILGKIGFSTVEAALIRKDIRAFTRRRELMSIFIMPIVFIILPISQSFGSSAQGVPQVSMMFTAMLFLFPAGLMSMSLGNMLVGEEGTSVWRIYTSPITPKNYVKAKLSFLTAMAVLVTIITGIVAILFYQPSTKIIVAGFVEAICLIATIGPIALSIGFKGADFTVSRRARMIRQEWALISLVVCGLTGLAVLAPLIPYAISTFIPGFTLLSANSLTDLILPLAISAVIAAVISAIFYRIDIDSAKELFRKAEN